VNGTELSESARTSLVKPGNGQGRNLPETEGQR